MRAFVALSPGTSLSLKIGGSPATFMARTSKEPLVAARTPGAPLDRAAMRCATFILNSLACEPAMMVVVVKQYGCN